MGVLTIDGHMLRKALIAGANELEKNKDYVDSLNVFPVPDGDTGINMALTTIAAAREVEKLNTPNIYDVAKAASSGSLRGARGNSGVILSQLFRGFARGLEGKSVATAGDLANAFLQGSETAYKAVMKPKEGTILTVAKAFAEFAIESCFDTDEIGEMLKDSIKYAHKILDKTTDMLPELKQADVVDAGGQGFLYIIEGAFDSGNSEGEITLLDPQASKSIQPGVMPVGASITADIEFGYCTEFFINVESISEETEDKFKNYLQTIGDSIVVVSDEDIIKVHVHSNNPGVILEKALKIGPLSNLKIENMRLQHTNIISFVQTTKEEKQSLNTDNTPCKDVGFIAVVAGEGLADMFRSLGADKIIEGGQTMNPSTEDILDAIELVNADEIFILPNNKNIILAAEQAAILTDKTVYVIPSKTVPQGVTAIVSFVPGFSADENISGIKEAMESVSTGQVTFAVRDSQFEDKQISEGDILGMVEGKISIVEKDVNEVSKKLIDEMFEVNNGEIMSIYYGEGINQEDAKNLVEYVHLKYPACEVSLMNGSQPLYYYIFSLE